MKQEDLPKSLTVFRGFYTKFKYITWYKYVLTWICKV